MSAHDLQDSQHPNAVPVAVPERDNSLEVICDPLHPHDDLSDEDVARIEVLLNSPVPPAAIEAAARSNRFKSSGHS